MWLASCMTRSNRAHWSQCCVGAPVIPGVRRSFLAMVQRGWGHGKRWCALGLGRRRGGALGVLGGSLLMVPSIRMVVWMRRFLDVFVVGVLERRRFFSLRAAMRAEITRWMLMARSRRSCGMPRVYHLMVALVARGGGSCVLSLLDVWEERPELGGCWEFAMVVRVEGCDGGHSWLFPLVLDELFSGLDEVGDGAFGKDAGVDHVRDALV